MQHNDATETMTNQESRFEQHRFSELWEKIGSGKGSEAELEELLQMQRDYWKRKMDADITPQEFGS